MCYLKGMISLLLLLQKFFELSIWLNYIEMTKTFRTIYASCLTKKVVDDYYVFHKFLITKSMLCIPKCSIKDLFFREAYGGALMEHLRINKVYKMLHKHFCWPKIKHVVDRAKHAADLFFKKVVYGFNTLHLLLIPTNFLHLLPIPTNFLLIFMWVKHADLIKTFQKEVKERRWWEDEFEPSHGELN